MTAGAAAAGGAPLMYGLFKPECYAKYFEQGDYLDLACLRLLVSKCLSLGIILGALLVKVPQIVAIVRARSTRGLAPSMYVLETLGYAITVAYNVRMDYAFSTYGEAVFLLLQGLVLVLLLGVYNKRVGLSLVAWAVYAALGYYLYVLAPLEQLRLFQTATIPLFAASRLPQLARNFAARSTGVLSPLTVGLNAAGSAARVFTTLTEVPDTVVLAGILASCAMNCAMLLQVVLYWGNKTATSGKQSTKSSGKAGKTAIAATAGADTAAAGTEATPSKKSKKSKKVE